jgi:hypothetical protein
MNDVFVTCIKNGRVDQFGLQLVSGSSYTLSWSLARDLWLSGYVSVTDASVFDSGSVDVRRPNLSAELAAQTAGVTASRTLALTDNGMVLNCNSGSAIVLTISPESSVAWAGVSCVAIYQAGAGASSFAAGSGVTLRGTPPTPAQYATHAIMRVGANEWAYL